ncbi:DUF6143 family protein [Clostridium cylindrosporum]|uniref:Uncharacterized protein n=1 Tax=Clostridium cylindrosporum DSM 605 TaxID=1121307 RepID=A0A0J8D7S7_CLOCY|nr:DUF6143 family protein [Clostridium cylindrosporum]KMT21937.1 hypothetical protein CLCY_3c02080 [Clostridium cylindrosporum DSM 605]
MGNYYNNDYDREYERRDTYRYDNEDNYYHEHNRHHQCDNHIKPSIVKPSLDYNVSVPISLAKSLEGKYFVGHVENLTFGRCTGAWARLYNPKDSGVNLHVTVWTVSDLSESPFRAGIWFNTNPPGVPYKSNFVTPANLALHPLPKSRIKLQYSKDVTGEPNGGDEAYFRIGQPGSTLVSEEDGKFIFHLEVPF